MVDVISFLACIVAVGALAWWCNDEGRSWCVAGFFVGGILGYLQFRHAPGTNAFLQKWDAFSCALISTVLVKGVWSLYQKQWRSIIAAVVLLPILFILMLMAHLAG